MVGVLQGLITERFTLFTFTLNSAKYYILLYFLCQIILPIKGNPNGNLLEELKPRCPGMGKGSIFSFTSGGKPFLEQPDTSKYTVLR